MTSTMAPTTVGEALAADPFTSLAVHYGMLLGVSDFQAMLANPRGKLRLHQAWQHGPGVVWGLDVQVVENSNELKVTAGLAIDGVGREISLGVEHCVDVAAWLAGHRDVTQPRETADDITFNVEVILRHSACLSRPVPAVSASCDGATTETAWSRILETGELELRPYLDGARPADDRNGELPLLRALVRDGVVPGDVSAASWLDAFRAVAAKEVAQTAPPAFHGGSANSTRLFPNDLPGEIVLADLPGLRLVKTGAIPHVEAPSIDLGIRRTHISTWLIEELLGELLEARHGGATFGGPTVSKLVRANATVTLTLSGPLVESTIAPGTSLSQFDDPTGWTAVPLSGALAYTAPAGTTPANLVLTLPDVPTATRSYRLVLAGTGPTPVVGLVDGLPTPLNGGNDLTFTIGVAT